MRVWRATPKQVGEFVRIFRRGNTWHANLQYEGSQRRQSLKTKSKKEARLRALRLESAVREGGPKRPSEATSIVQAIDEYLAFSNIEGRAKTTLARYRTVYQSLLLFAAQSQATKISQVYLPFLDAFRRQRLAAGRVPRRCIRKRKSSNN